MLYCFLAGLVFASSYCSAQVSLNTLYNRVEVLDNRIEVLEKKLEHGGRRIQSISFNSKSVSHWGLSMLMEPDTTVSSELRVGHYGFCCSQRNSQSFGFLAQA